MAQSYKATVARTEVAGVLGVDHTIWGAETGKKHSTLLTEVNQGSSTSAISMEYSRSYYDATSRSDAKFINDGDTQTVGTLYNWKAATAGTGDAYNEYIATDSICPAGWTLPNRQGFYDFIITLYGGGEYNASTNPTGIHGTWVSSSHNVNDAHIFAMAQAMRRAPMSVPFSGVYAFHRGITTATGTSGSFVTASTIIGEVYYLYFSESALSTLNHSLNGLGFSIRCVAQ